MSELLKPTECEDPNDPIDAFILALSDWIDDEVYKACVKEMDNDQTITKA